MLRFMVCITLFGVIYIPFIPSTTDLTHGRNPTLVAVLVGFTCSSYVHDARYVSS